MGISEPLSTYSTRDIENTVIFIADSLGHKWLPDAIAQEGVAGRAIAPSLYTAASIPSIVTSRYPSSHKVWKFSDSLDSSTTLLHESPNAGLNVDNVWGSEYEDDEKPTLTFLDVNQNTQLEDLDEPFTYVVHDHGGHMPYGAALDNFKPVEEFWKRHAGDEDVILDRYHHGIQGTVERFFGLLDDLRSRNLLDETLVIFTSDHGELLGEHGLYGHCSPMVPELVEVPMVFIGPGLPEGEEYTHLLSSLDIAPTTLGAQNRPVPRQMQGIDIWNEAPPDGRTVYSEVWRSTKYGRLVEYKATSIWNERGGLVFHHGPALSRALYALGYHFGMDPTIPTVSHGLKQGFPDMLRVYVPKERYYGEPGVTFSKEDVPTADFERRSEPDVQVDKEQLRKLGYIE